MTDIQFMVCYMLYLAFSWAVLGYYSQHHRKVEDANLNSLEVEDRPKAEDR